MDPAQYTFRIQGGKWTGEWDSAEDQQLDDDLNQGDLPPDEYLLSGMEIVHATATAGVQGDNNLAPFQRPTYVLEIFNTDEATVGQLTTSSGHKERNDGALVAGAPLDTTGMDTDDDGTVPSAKTAPNAGEPMEMDDDDTRCTAITAPNGAGLQPRSATGSEFETASLVSQSQLTDQSMHTAPGVHAAAGGGGSVVSDASSIATRLTAPQCPW